MDLKSLSQTVARFAPFLGSVLPIPGGAVLGQAIAKMFGGDIADTDDLINRINKDPEAGIKLLQIQSDERIEIERIAVDKLRAQNEELANARNREIEISKTSFENRDKVPARIATLYLSGYFILAFTCLFVIWNDTVTKEELEPLIQLLKDMGLATVIVLTYYFGASNKR